ncbi:hypothetical protein H4R19_003378 [Coemansia spiralis]|nr:hypothetical protein H4R19_003378 [Coemansia spiralis]
MFSRTEYIGLYALNSFSIVCSLFVAIFIHMYRNDITVLAATQTQQKRRQQQRQSRPQRQRSMLRPFGTQATMYLSLPAPLRLLFIASAVDVLYSAFRMYFLGVGAPWFGSSNQEINCKASMTGMTFFTLLSVFVRALVCVNLHLLIFTNVSRVLHYERQFLAAALAVALVLAVIPLFTNSYTWMDIDPVSGRGRCGYFRIPPAADRSSAQAESLAQAAVKKGLAIMWTTNFAGVTLTVAYCALVIVSVVVQLAHKHIALTRISKAQNLIEVPALQRREFLRTTARVVRRILQFPLMIFVSHALEVIYGMVTLSRALELMRENAVSTTSATAVDSSLTRFYLASHIMLGLEGVITLLFLPLEPPIRLMLRTMYLRRRAEISRLGTIRSAPRRRVTERWPSARPPPAPSIDAVTVSSHQLSLDGPQPVHGDKSAGALPDATSDLLPPLPLSIVPSNAASESRPTPSVVVVVDNHHAVTHVSRADDQSSSAVQRGSGPLRRMTVRWAQRLQGKQDQETPPPLQPAPGSVQRAQTVADLPWDIVTVPRRRSRTGSVAIEPADECVPANPARALRDDGLPTQQWYVPHTPVDAAEERADAGP